METKLHVFVCQMFAHHSYPEFDQKLRELRAVPLMHSISAARTVLTAKELKDALRKTLDDSDRILVVEVCVGWASRRADNNLGDLFPPRGGFSVHSFSTYNPSLVRNLRQCGCWA